jgi:nucleoid-associated protein YgaU
MGKETKIGLAVIGVLLVGFGGLLARKLALFNGATATEARVVADVSMTDGMTSRPPVSLAQQAPAEQAHSNDIWSSGGRPQDSQPVDRYSADAAPGKLATGAADDAQPLVVASQPAAVSPSNPFRTPEARTIAAEEASTEPVAEAPPDEPAELPVTAAAEETAIEDAQPASNELQLPTQSEDVPGGVSARALTIDEDTDAALPPRQPEKAVESEPEPEQPLVAVPQQRPESSRWNSPPTQPVSMRDEVEPATPPVAAGKYVIQPNDSLWIISEKVYGTGGYFKALYEHNRRRLPHADRLVVGTQLEVPPIATLENNYPTLCPKQRKSAVVKARAVQASTRSRRGSDTYIVAEGDTLFDIARYELGKASRWAEIYELNREVLGDDHDHLAPGTELTLPARSQPADVLTRQNDSRLQR